MRPEEELRFLILGAQREGNRLLAAQLSPLGLTPSQAEVIRCLGDYGSMSLRALGELLVCESGSPSRLVDALVSREIVARWALCATPSTDLRILGLPTVLRVYIQDLFPPRVRGRPRIF